MAESGVMSLTDQLHRYGFIVPITVEPSLFGKQPDMGPTAWHLRQWLQKNLKDLWDCQATRRHLWTTECGYFDVTCMSKAEAEKVREFFCHPPV